MPLLSTCRRPFPCPLPAGSGPPVPADVAWGGLAPSPGWPCHPPPGRSCPSPGKVLHGSVSPRLLPVEHWLAAPGQITACRAGKAPLGPGQSRGDPAPLPAWCGLAASLSARGFAARRGRSYPSAPARQRPSAATCRSSHVIGVDVFTETFDFQLRVLEGGQTWVLRLLPVPPAGQVTVLLVTCLTRLRGGPGSAAGGQLARARRHQARSTLCPGLSPRPADPR